MADLASYRHEIAERKLLLKQRASPCKAPMPTTPRTAAVRDQRLPLGSSWRSQEREHLASTMAHGPHENNGPHDNTADAQCDGHRSPSWAKASPTPRTPGRMGPTVESALSPRSHGSALSASAGSAHRSGREGSAAVKRIEPTVYDRLMECGKFRSVVAVQRRRSEAPADSTMTSPRGAASPR